VILGRLKISIYRNLLGYFISFHIDSGETAAGVSDRLGIGLVLGGSFRDLPRELRSGRVFSVIRILRSTVPSFIIIIIYLYYILV
jgi:hypothetical protein